jgi:tRNA (guanine-N7-)-methyltransferase
MGNRKLVKYADLDLFTNVIEMPYRVAKSANFDLRGEWNNNYFHNNNPIVLELGCGKGEYTVGLARQYPDKNFIGIDIKGARIWTGAGQALEEGLKNVAFLRSYVDLLPIFFSENEISEIWITFPDPQMKKYRKRLTSTNFLQKYSSVMNKGGIVHLKTDSRFLFKYTSEIVRLNNFEILAETDNLYESDHADDIAGIKTYYEMQWLARGLSIKYLKFIPHADNLIEPDTEIEEDDYRSFGRDRRSEVIIENSLSSIVRR